jgi:hypothetical protein
MKVIVRPEDSTISKKISEEQKWKEEPRLSPTSPSYACILPAYSIIVAALGNRSSAIIVALGNRSSAIIVALGNRRLASSNLLLLTKIRAMMTEIFGTSHLKLLLFVNKFY